MNSTGKMSAEDDPIVAQALKNFKASADAWSEAASSRPRSTVKNFRPGWQLATAWALGCVLAAGSLSGAFLERNHRHELAHTAAAHAAAQKAAQQQLAMQQRPASQGDQDLLATVDTEISRAVPAAMEPLAQMMDEKSADNNGAQ